jgi:hypothetical protein
MKTYLVMSIFCGLFWGAVARLFFGALAALTVGGVVYLLVFFMLMFLAGAAIGNKEAFDVKK